MSHKGYQISPRKSRAINLADREVDFVATGFDEVVYYQVCASVLDENTLRRELYPLQRIPDNHPKVLLTLDTVGAGANYEGIRQYNVLDWLLRA